MTKAKAWDVFVSYRWVEPDMSWVREQLTPALERSGLKVCVDFKDFRPGRSPILEMDRALEQSRRTLAVLGPEYLAGNRGTLLEALRGRGHDLRGAWSSLIPLVLRPTKKRLPRWLRDLISVDWTDPQARPHQWRILLATLGARDLDAPPPGEPAPAERRKSQPTDEFAIELLSEPVILTRTEAGSVRVAISRDDARGHIYTTKAKRDLCQATLSTPERLAAAQRLDREIHQFLLGRSKRSSLIVHLDNLPLRWASGGVLSVVRWRQAPWTPFFFRDIPPYGWNIALGSSEKNDDLNDPWSFLWREFLEETLVLDGEPRPGIPIDFKPFVVEKLEIAREKRLAAKFAAEHIKARQLADGLIIQHERHPSPLLDPKRCVVGDLARTDAEILISKGSTRSLHRNVLVAINLLELGIEVVKILEYKIEPDDFILDGEMLRSDSGKNLVRMPVALISHTYLSRVFRTLDLKSSKDGEIQPSIQAPAIPPDALHLYTLDARRRSEIAQGLDPRSTPWERERYGQWMHRFRDLFFDREGIPRKAHPRAWFTPATAKILSYYFAGSRKRRAVRPRSVSSESAPGDALR
jgi:hypothetical protein